MPVRRCADAASVQHVWDAVRCTLQQRQQTDMPRLTKYIQRVCDVSSQRAEQFVRQVMKDNLLVCVKKTAQKGNKSGVVTENFKIPSADDNTPVDDGHDWYCIECHLAGDVTPCQSCYRVFHPKCATAPNPKLSNSQTNDRISISSESSSKSPDQNVTTSSIKTTILIEDNDTNDDADCNLFCSVCRMLQKEKEVIIEREELNYLLNFTLNRIRIWLPANITDAMAPRVPHPWMTEQEVAWRVRHLLYQTMDIPIMEMKLRMKEYSRLAEFHSDVITIQHNVAVFHGLESQEMQGSELMLTDSRYDLVELQQCVDCYRHSNEKRNDSWFCIPCRPPHNLVWAKQKGYPHWPAKVIRVTPDGQHDVRFFGAKHLRAVVEKTSVRPIDTNVQKLQLKRTQAFNKAMQELTEHQRLLQAPHEVAEIMSQVPEIKLKSPSKQTKQKRLKEVPVRSEELEAQDSVPEKKKRGRKPGNSAKKGKSLQQGFPMRENVVKISPDRHSTADSTHNDHVSSSTEHLYPQPTLTLEPPTPAPCSSSLSRSSQSQSSDRAYCDPVERLRRRLEEAPDRDAATRAALDAMSAEVERLRVEHSEFVRGMVREQNEAVSEIKKKQWCYNCEQEAIYHCCWNTAYCSTGCQQQHWQSEHKKVCRRKR